MAKAKKKAVASKKTSKAPAKKLSKKTVLKAKTNKPVAKPAKKVKATKKTAKAAVKFSKKAPKASLKKSASGAKKAVKAPAKKAIVKKVATKKASTKAPKTTAVKAPQMKLPAAMLSPLDDRILVRTSGVEKKTPGGLFIPDTVSDTSGNLQGVVTAVGRGHLSKKGKLRTMDVTIGDQIVFTQYAGSKVSIDGQDFVILRESDVLGIVQK